MWFVATMLVILPLGCSSPSLDCNLDVSAACQPLYVPTFDNVYAMTLAPHCGSGARACHSDTGRGGMSLATVDGAYDELLAPGKDRVIPGDPSCSTMIIRAYSTDGRIKMPPGASLPAPELCALVQWIDMGALRSPAPTAARAAPATGRGTSPCGAP